jgi:hypothetical protein
MKFNLRPTFALGALCASLVLPLHAAPDAGAVDFGPFKPADGQQFVEVNVSSDIIAMVTNLTKNGEPEIADALKGLKRIHVNVIGVDESNRDDIEKSVSAIRNQLDGKGWEKVVTAIQKDQDVGVYMKMRGAEAVEGLVVTVLQDKKQAVFVNIVGDIRPEKLAMIGERFNVEPLKKLHLTPEKKEREHASREE